MTKVDSSDFLSESTHTPGVLKTVDAARILKCTASFVRSLLRSGYLRGFKIGQHWRITENALNEFIRKGEVECITDKN